MRTVDPLRQPDGAATHRSVVPPFLPTLGLALVAGLLSFVCHEPAEAPKAAPERPPVLSLAPGLSPFDPGRALLTAELDPVPASEAFARLTPLVTGSIDSAPHASRPARFANTSRSDRRKAPPSRIAVGHPAAGQAPAATQAAAKSVPVPPPFAEVEAENSRFLPRDALPFADTADAVLDAARGLGTRVTTLGSSVSTMVTALR
ncbi:hypothetical protein [Methylorubrum salsuginis]|uniref:Uncharacterized protein n=1 Tax=Methylorubrum salsuginis TaxID=414703 RepID=A0A1I4E666_9HYPH|nr:hypothetical protein [Methylorubrum salsuginis]SFL00659.1 hypothetical protein SAMN04488125_10787 [Methylorubrum salsuginis]